MADAAVSAPFPEDGPGVVAPTPVASAGDAVIEAAEEARQFPWRAQVTDEELATCIKVWVWASPTYRAVTVQCHGTHGRRQAPMHPQRPLSHAEPLAECTLC